jgi:hypothetical protein
LVAHQPDRPLQENSATGRPWLGFHTVKGDVLILDNELHGETSANRIPKVADARGIGVDGDCREHLR